MKIKIYYDKECPFCKNYANYIKLKQSYSVEILNARENIEDIKSFFKNSFDINDGLIVVFNDKIYQGSEAVIFLDKLGKEKSFYDNFVFKKFIYPIIKLIRKIVLLILGRNPNIKF